MKLLTTRTVVPVVNTGFNFSVGTVDFKIVIAGKFAIIKTEFTLILTPQFGNKKVIFFISLFASWRTTSLINFMEENTFNPKKLKESFHVSEVLFAISGVLILISAFVIYQTENFTLWNLAKLFYLLALILFIKYA